MTKHWAPKFSRAPKEEVPSYLISVIPEILAVWNGGEEVGELHGPTVCDGVCFFLRSPCDLVFSNEENKYEYSVFAKGKGYISNT